jgi:signal transduction histidine kinase
VSLRKRATTLERRLTRRMILSHMVALALFFALGVFPVVISPALGYLGSTQALDPTVTARFAHALVRTEAGTLAVAPGDDLRTLIAEHPDIYFFAQADDGASVALGTLPDVARQVADGIALIDTLDLRADPEELGAILVRTEDSPVGPVRVMTGGGPTLGIASLLRNVAIGLAVGVGLVVTFASAFGVPLLVRRELRGLKKVAEDAGRIDIDARGVQLRTEGVPAEIASLVTAVNSALARLDAAYAARQRFMADAAHEVRTPIAILRARLESAKPFPERQSLLLDVERLAGLAEQLLDLQRLAHTEDGFERIDLVALAEAVVGDLAPIAIGSGYDLSLEPAPAPVMIDADAKSLYRAVANIVQNAIAHGGGHGEIVVAVTPERSLTVSDQGQGVPAEDRERIFEPFSRLKPSSQGAGLGLNLVKAILARHGAEIEVADNPGGGARFVMTFPAPA